MAAAHLEGFGSLEGVFHAKSEIFEGLGEGGTAIVNADNEFWPKWQARGIHCAFSIEDQRQPFHASNVVINQQGCAEFVMVTPQGEVSLTLAIPGRHNVANALAAAAGTLALGASLASVKAGLEQMAPVKGPFLRPALGWSHPGGRHLQRQRGIRAGGHRCPDRHERLQGAGVR